MAHQILYLSGLTDYEKGLTINVGTVKGGTNYNVVPDLAEAKIDLRATTWQNLREAEEKLLNLLPVLKRTTVRVSGQINRTPLEATPQNIALYTKAQRLADELGFSLPAVGVDGVSDGNFSSALGIATLDGLGPVGDGAHSRIWICCLRVRGLVDGILR